MSKNNTIKQYCKSNIAVRHLQLSLFLKTVTDYRYRYTSKEPLAKNKTIEDHHNKIILLSLIILYYILYFHYYDTMYDQHEGV